MEPKVQSEDVKLAGIQRVVRFGIDRFDLVLPELRETLLRKLDAIPDRSDSLRLFGYWQFVDKDTRVYLAGIQVDRLDRFQWHHPSGVLQWDLASGLVAWDLGPTTFAVFRRQGVGDTSPFYGSIPTGYAYDARFLGDFEVVSYAEWLDRRHVPEPPECENEVWIPVRASGQR